MRLSILLGTVATAIAAFTLTTTHSAQADDEFDVTVASGTVTVVAKGGWHINKEYPWKFVAGDTKLDKSRFALEEKTASVKDVPKGVGKLKGAVCSVDKCKNFEKDVTVQ